MAQIHALTPEGRLPNAAQAHVREVVDPVQYKRASPSGSTDLDTLWTPGTYPLISTVTDWQAQHYPLNGRGTLLVQEWTAGNGSQTFIGGAIANPSVFVRYRQSNATGAWKNISDWAAGDTTTLTAAKTYADGINLIRPFVNGSTDLNTVQADGEYPLAATVTNWSTQNYPANIRGHLSVRSASAWRFQTVRSNEPTGPRVWTRVFNGSWGAWVLLSGGGGAVSYLVSEGVGNGSIRHDMLVDDMLAYHDGPIGTDGAVPVALTFDDYPREFRDLMRDALTSRNIPYTLALSSGMYDPAAAGTGGTWEAVYNGAQGTTWSEINGWLTSDGAEVANHSRRHQGGSGLAYLRAEIIDGLAELQAALPAKPIWCWVQPSANYYDQADLSGAFTNGSSIDKWAGTAAGKYIWDHHAMMTGVRLINGKNTAPRRGAPVQGMDRAWISSAAGITSTQTAITGALSAGRGLIVGSHATDISAARITAAQFEGFLDWLVTEQSAGRVRLMTLSQWAVADTRFPA